MQQPPPFRDVRMSGFRDRNSVAEAWDWIDSRSVAMPRTSETVPLELAYARRAAATITSSINVPPFDRSAMDGFAVIADDTTGATTFQPTTMRIVGNSFPGNPCSTRVNSGECVQIMTGAPIPDGADAVVPIEYVDVSEDRIRVATTVGPMKNIGRTGEDLKAGDAVVQQGQFLRPQDVAVLASIGIPEVSVLLPPRVRIVVTGNELVQPGSDLPDYQIYEANSFLLRGAVTRDGGQIESVHFVADNPDSIRAALQQAGADIILISGGSSVGAEDYAPQLVAELGDLPIHGIRMRPSSPTGIGKIESTTIFLLPGNPVSCMCAYDFFAGRFIRKMLNDVRDWPFPSTIGKLSKKVSSPLGRTDYCRAQLKGDQIQPLAISGASILSSTTRADGFFIIPEESEGFSAGTEVPIYIYDDRRSPQRVSNRQPDIV
ncbi:gephyrin-like molybdotransferase Glp [Thalassoglobus sp. JC818]|uniref:molybdopterin molybdotransferase MoeA n=1 Tax=Thalassoglobus sp. JC818 TaxID=3232136 RepID=UPI00345AB87D